METATWLLAASTALLFLATVALARVAFLQWKSAKRLEWLTGALETHSTAMLRIEAARGINGKPVPLIWWDPNRERRPFPFVHKDQDKLETIYLYLPEEHRQCGKKK